MDFPLFFSKWDNCCDTLFTSLYAPVPFWKAIDLKKKEFAPKEFRIDSIWQWSKNIFDSVTYLASILSSWIWLVSEFRINLFPREADFFLPVKTYFFLLKKPWYVNRKMAINGLFFGIILTFLTEKCNLLTKLVPVFVLLNNRTFLEKKKSVLPQKKNFL